MTKIKKIVILLALVISNVGVAQINPDTSDLLDNDNVINEDLQNQSSASYDASDINIAIDEEMD